MENIIFVIIGTTHETTQEKRTFELLNKYVVEYKKYIYWLCEGESYGRKCISIKDNNIHLLTDALFVNMMVIDKITGTPFYERCVELFVTIKNSEHKKLIIGKNKYLSDLIEKSPDDIVEIIQKMETSMLIQIIKKICETIVNLVIDKKIVSVNEKCVLDFYKTGTICENEILTDLREKSFIQHIMKYILWLSSQTFDCRPLLFLTVGCDHVLPIKNFFSKHKLDVRYFCI